MNPLVQKANEMCVRIQMKPAHRTKPAKLNIFDT